MDLARRKFLRLTACVAALLALSNIAWAQAYPSRPVRIIAGYPAGGIVDVFARLIGQCLSERFGQTFIIENKPGAAGNLATAAVVKANPDGYTLLMIGNSNTINSTFYENLNFNFLTDIAPVASLYRDGTNVLVVNPSFPAKTLSEFIAYAKTNPGKINFGSPGVGSPAHIEAEQFKLMAGIDLVHVPYRGQPQVLTDLLGGQLQVGLAPLGIAIEHIRTGRLRALGVTQATRRAPVPDVPAIGEFVSGFESSGWQAIGAPKDTPREIVERLNKEICGCLAEPKTKERFTQVGYYTPFASSPAELTRFIAEDTKKWAKVIEAANIKRE